MLNHFYFEEKKFSLMPLRPNTKIAKITNWQTDEETLRGYNYTPEQLVPSAGVRCGVPYEDGYLLVVDVDDVQLLTRFLDESGVKLPDTFTVKTNRGFHFYYVVDEPPATRTFRDFLDLCGRKHYVVGAGCPHPDGGFYAVVDDSPLYVERLSEYDKFVDACEVFHARLKGKSQTLGDLSKEKNRLNNDDVVTVGGRDEFLFRKASQLRGQGLEYEEIYPVVARLNRTLCKPPLLDIEVVTKVVSACKYSPEVARDGAIAHPPLIEPSSKAIINPDHDKEELTNPYSLAEGYVKQIAENILLSAVRPYQNFSLAASLAIVGSAAQGSFLLPNLERKDRSSGSVTSFHWLIAPSSAGKDSYKKAVEEYVKASNPYVPMGLSGSFYGLRTYLYAHNSRLFVCDEFQEEMARMSSSSATRQILSEMKELASDKIEMEEILTKDRCYPAVRMPYYSVFAVGTDSGFFKYLTGEHIGGGLLSRFTVWHETRPTEKQSQRDFVVRRDEIEFLQKIYSLGAQNTSFDGDDYKRAIEEIQTYSGDAPGANRRRDPISHTPQCVARHIVPISKSAAELFTDFLREQERRYFAYTAEHMSDSELSPGSIVDRSPKAALKAAAIHCIGRNDQILISLKDVEFGIAVARLTSSRLESSIGTRAHSNCYDKNKNIVVAKMKDLRTKGNSLGLSLRDISRHLRGIRHTDLLTIMVDLCTGGQAECYGKGQDKPFDFSDGMPVEFPKGKFPYGSRFKI